MPTLGIVYAIDNGMPRRVISDERDGVDLGRIHGLAKGEAILVIDNSNLVLNAARMPHPEWIKAQLRQEGIEPAEPRTAIVKDGVVVAIAAIHPALDSVPDATLVEAYSEKIVPGVSYDGKDFIIPTKVISAVTDKDGMEQPEKVIQPEVLTKAVAAEVEVEL